MMNDDDRDNADNSGAPTDEAHSSWSNDPYAARPTPFDSSAFGAGPAYPRLPAQGALGTPPSYWRKFVAGSLVFVGGSYVLILALTYVVLNYPALGLGAFIQPPKANVLILSGLTWQNLIFFIVIIGLWLLVQRLGLIPRPQPYTPQPRRRQFNTNNPFQSVNDSSEFSQDDGWRRVNQGIVERDDDNSDDRSN